MLAPLAPFIAEELYQLAKPNSKESLHQTPWPKTNKAYLKDEFKSIPVQINGKVRARIEIPSAELANQELVLQRAKTDDSVAKWLAKGLVVREIYVPERIVNFVIET